MKTKIKNKYTCKCSSISHRTKALLDDEIFPVRATGDALVESYFLDYGVEIDTVDIVDIRDRLKNKLLAYPDLEPDFNIDYGVQVDNGEKANYSPNICTVKVYNFSFLYDERKKIFKVHGLWPIKCTECPSCNFPSCCNVSSVKYIEPTDPDEKNFLNEKCFENWANNNCFNINMPLFKHEFLKHGSCTPFKDSASNYLQQIIRLYDQYFLTHVNDMCPGFKEIILILDADFNYISSKCRIPLKA